MNCRFPKDLQRRDSWINNMEVADWKPFNNDRICSKHFKERFLYQTKQKVSILSESIPTMFQEIPKYLQPKMLFPGLNTYLKQHIIAILLQYCQVLD